MPDEWTRTDTLYAFLPFHNWLLKMCQKKGIQMCDFSVADLSLSVMISHDSHTFHDWQRLALFLFGCHDVTPHVLDGWDGKPL